MTHETAVRESAGGMGYYMAGKRGCDSAARIVVIVAVAVRNNSNGGYIIMIIMITMV